MTDARTYIRVHDGMPDHPKIDGLSDKAFRLLVESWCWCARHLTDGKIPERTWTKRGTPGARRELLDEGLVETTPTGVFMHDYLEHQRSADEVAAMREQRRVAGAAGGKAKAARLATAKRVASEVLDEPSSKTVASTEVDTASNEAVDSARKRRASQLPADFSPTDAHRHLAEAEGVDLDREFSRFVDHWRGNGKAKVDWDATLRNWLRSPLAPRGSTRPAERRPLPHARDLRTPPPGLSDEQMDAWLREGA